MTDITHVPLSREAATQSEVALERIVADMIRSGHDAAEKGFDREETVAATLVAVQPILASTAATMRALGVQEARALAAEARL